MVTDTWSYLTRVLVVLVTVVVTVVVVEVIITSNIITNNIITITMEDITMVAMVLVVEVVPITTLEEVEAATKVSHQEEEGCRCLIVVTTIVKQKQPAVHGRPGPPRLIYLYFCTFFSKKMV